VTYSLVAFDPDTGECGVAVQSHWFSVGTLVTWGEPGVGAVATQANVEIAYGPRGLARMREGASAPEALALHEKMAKNLWRRALKGAAAVALMREMMACAYPTLKVKSQEYAHTKKRLQRTLDDGRNWYIAYRRCPSTLWMFPPNLSERV